jgi:copper oxidase (laccase) domain-containing protein
MKISDNFALILKTSKTRDGNMGFEEGDSQEALENRKRFLSPLGLSLINVVGLNQVHGSTVIKVSQKDKGKGAFSISDGIESDGMITD